MHIGECVINLLKVSMCLKALLVREVHGIFSTCLIWMGFKSFSAFSYNVTLPCPHLGQALALPEKAVPSDSDTSAPCTGKAGSSAHGCLSPSSKDMVLHWSGRRGKKKWEERNGSALCSRAMQLRGDAWGRFPTSGAVAASTEELHQAAHASSCTSPSTLEEGNSSKDDARVYLHSAWPDLPVGVLQ